jgi:hypothetical protein
MGVNRRMAGHEIRQGSKVKDGEPSRSGKDEISFWMRFSIFLRNELTVTTNHLLETPYELYK